MGYVDLHNHLLPALDDGAGDEEESVEIAKALSDAGFSDIVATPHVRPGLEVSLEAAEAARTALQSRLDRDLPGVRLHAGCENHLTPDFVARAEAGDPRPIGRGPWVLVELPFATPVQGLGDIVFRLHLRGLHVLFAHPERCAHFAGNLPATRTLHDAGARFQMETGSLDNRYGPEARRFARTLLDEGLVSAAATDVHSLAEARATEASLRTLRRAAGEEAFTRLVQDNPRRFLDGGPVGE